MGSASDFHNQDFDALESYLERLTPTHQGEPYLVSPFAVWRLGRKLARQKKREGISFLIEATAAYRQPLEVMGGWLTASPISAEMTKFAEDLLVKKFSRPGLKVDNFLLIWTGMTDGPEGTYQSFTARFDVS